MSPWRPASTAVCVALMRLEWVPSESGSMPDAAACLRRAASTSSYRMGCPSGWTNSGQSVAGVGCWTGCAERKRLIQVTGQKRGSAGTGSTGIALPRLLTSDLDRRTTSWIEPSG